MCMRAYAVLVLMNKSLRTLGSNKKSMTKGGKGATAERCNQERYIGEPVATFVATFVASPLPYTYSTTCLLHADVKWPKKERANNVYVYATSTHSTTRNKEQQEEEIQLGENLKQLGTGTGTGTALYTL